MIELTDLTYAQLEAALVEQRLRWEELFAWLASAAYACETTGDTNDPATTLLLSIEQYAAAEAMVEVREKMRELDPSLPRRKPRGKSGGRKRGGKRR